jgi:hypothetical protein
VYDHWKASPYFLAYTVFMSMAVAIAIAIAIATWETVVERSG